MKAPKNKPKTVWDEPTKNYVRVRFMYGDSVTNIAETAFSVEEILREAFL